MKVAYYSCASSVTSKLSSGIVPGWPQRDGLLTHVKIILKSILNADSCDLCLVRRVEEAKKKSRRGGGERDLGSGARVCAKAQKATSGPSTLETQMSIEHATR